MSIVRVVGACFCLALFAFCAFGFLASYEPPDVAGIRVLDGILGFASLTGAVVLVSPGIDSKRLALEGGASRDS